MFLCQSRCSVDPGEAEEEEEDGDEWGDASCKVLPEQGGGKYIQVQVWGKLWYLIDVIPSSENFLMFSLQVQQVGNHDCY